MCACACRPLCTAVVLNSGVLPAILSSVCLVFNRRRSYACTVCLPLTCFVAVWRPSLAAHASTSLARLTVRAPLLYPVVCRSRPHVTKLRRHPPNGWLLVPVLSPLLFDCRSSLCRSRVFHHSWSSCAPFRAASVVFLLKCVCLLFDICVCGLPVPVYVPPPFRSSALCLRCG